jgi:NAD+ kinase
VRALFVVHPQRAAAVDLSSSARRWWEAHGHEVVQADGPASPSLDGIEAGAFDVAVSFGGDGTMLRTVEVACPLGIPVLGVNLGRMGYLTEVEPASLESALTRLLAKDYAIEERMTLEVAVSRGGSEGAEPEAERRYVALNEATVERAGPGHTIAVRVEIAGKPFLRYVADGVLVSTPTGSTAYNLSARGPIVSPRLSAMVLTPVSPHLLFDRSLVLEPDEVVRLVLDGPVRAALVVDGSAVVPLGPGDAVSCRGGEHPARLVTFRPRDFHAILRAKFGLADR